MSLRSMLLPVLALMLMSGTAFPATTNPTVRIGQGALRGVQEDGVDVFRGIPYAGDTGGQQRWRPPSAAPHWHGTREADKPGPICPQSTAARNGVVAPWLAGREISEDCLNLNIYSTAGSLHGRQPVMVWIHGGFARIGTGSRHDGKDLARKGVVVVTFNYRLDRLGLFAHPALSAEQPGALLGNYALMDMLAALRWVKQNIARFGGDPDNVTVFGQSSGGVAVTALMGSPLSKGLFQRAIAQSGVMADLDHERRLHEDLPGSPSLESDGATSAAALLPAGTAASAAALRALPWQALIAYTATQPAAALMPVVDGSLLPRPVTRTFADGAQQPVPFMVGTVDWEQSLFVNYQLPLAAVLGKVPAAEARAVYPGLDDKALADQWLADTGFHAPARFLANASADRGIPTWVYRFDHVPPAKPQQSGAAHSDDVPYLLAPDSLPGWPRDNPQEQRMAATLLDYWTNFARNGDPNGEGQAAWPRWHSAAGSGTQVLEVPVQTRTDAWRQRMDYHLQRYRQALQEAPPR